MDVFGEIAAKQRNMSKSQRYIAAYVTQNIQTAAYLNARELATACRVSEATVVRFAAHLGYTRYHQFQEALQDAAGRRLTSVERMDSASVRYRGGDLFAQVLNADIERIRTTINEIDRNAFTAAADAILSAKNIYIIGLRSASALSCFLGYYLNLMVPNVHTVTSDSADVFEQIFRIGEQDVMIGISFPRYSAHTAQALHYAHRRGARVISVTDSKRSPIYAVADHPLLAKSNMESFVDSLVAPMSLINALTVYVSLRGRDAIGENLEHLEEIWQNNEVYDNGK